MLFISVALVSNDKSGWRCPQKASWKGGWAASSCQAPRAKRSPGGLGSSRREVFSHFLYGVRMQGSGAQGTFLFGRFPGSWFLGHSSAVKCAVVFEGGARLLNPTSRLVLCSPAQTHRDCIPEGTFWPVTCFGKSCPFCSLLAATQQSGQPRGYHLCVSGVPSATRHPLGSKCSL